MFCYKCGAQLADSSVFCHKCGAKMPNNNANKESSDLDFADHNRQSSVLPEELHHEKIEMGKKEGKPTAKFNNTENEFKNFVNNYIRKTTEFESVEELLNSKVPQKFLKLGIGILAVVSFIFAIMQITDEGFSVMNVIGTIIIVFVFLGYPIALLADYIFSFRITGGDQKVDGNINADDLIVFLNRNLSYLSPYFHEWNYIQMKGFGVRGAITAGVQNALLGTRIGTEFGSRKRCFIEIHINPDHTSPDSGAMVYFLSTANKSLWADRYTCMTKAAPILHAAMKYYLEEYIADKENVSSVG